MNQYQKHQYYEAQKQFLHRYTPHCDYAITLQSDVTTFNLSDAQMALRLREISNSLRLFRSKLNRLLTGNGHRRKPEYVPLILTAIEGSTTAYQSNKTLHVHMALGNTGFTHCEQVRELIEQGCREIWVNIDHGTADVRVDALERGTAGRWISYLSKEAEYKKFDVIDYENTQIPRHLI